MTDIVEFLAARLDEDEIAIKAMGVEGAGRWWVGQRFDGSLDPEGSTVFVDVRRSDGLGYIHLGTPGMFAGPTAIHIARHDPARVLREVAAKRKLLAEHKHVPAVQSEAAHVYDFGCQTCHVDTHCGETMGLGWCETVRLMAGVYNQSPDYDPTWRVS